MLTPALFVFVTLARLGGVQQDALVRNTFKDGTDGWMAIGANARITSTTDPAVVGSSTGAIKLDYDIVQGGFSALTVAAPASGLKEAKSIRFRVKADANTPITIALQEDGGGRYAAVFYAPKDQWQTVELSTADLALAMDKNDPKDPNGHLDLDKVQGFFVADVAQFLAQGGDGPRKLLDIKMGAHSLYLSDFTVGKDEIAPRTTSKGDDIVLDTFQHPQLAWLGLNGVMLSKGSNGAAAGIKADYSQDPAKPALILTQLQPWVLTTAKAISLDMASTKSARLVIQVEENSGGKYNVMVQVPAGATAKTYRLAFADFKPADDSKDDNGKLDLGDIKTLNIIDLSGPADGEHGANSLWVGNVKGVRQ